MLWTIPDVDERLRNDAGLNFQANGIHARRQRVKVIVVRRIVFIAVLLAMASDAFAQYGTRIIDVDATGAIHIAGTFYGEIALGDTTLSAGNPEEKASFLAVLESDGQRRWAREFYSENQIGTGFGAIAASEASGGYLIANVYDSLRIDSTTWIYDDAVLRYAPGGRITWAAGNLGLWAVDLSLSGTKIYVASNSVSHASLLFTIIDTTGAVLWSSNMDIRKVASSINAGGNERIAIGGLSNDQIMIAQHDTTGGLIWTYLTDRGGFWASSVAVDTSGNTFFGARSLSGVQLGDSVVESPSRRYVGKVSSQGHLEWIRPISGPRGGSEVEVLLHDDRISAVMTVTDDPSPFENSLLLSEWDFSGNLLASVTLPRIWVWVADARNFTASRGDDLYFIGYALEPPDPDVLETILYDPESLTFVGKRRVGTHVKTERPEGYNADMKSIVYPTPAVANFTVEYSLSATARVTIEICDTLGRCMRRIDQGYQKAGKHMAHIRDESLARGVYFVRVVAGPNVSITPVHLVR